MPVSLFYWMLPAPNYVMSYYTPRFKTFEELSSHFSDICIIKTCVDLLISSSLKHPIKRVVVLLASWVINIIIYIFIGILSHSQKNFYTNNKKILKQKKKTYI